MIVAWETQERPCRVFEWDLGWCQLAGVCMAGAGWRASVRAGRVCLGGGESRMRSFLGESIFEK